MLGFYSIKTKSGVLQEYRVAETPEQALSDYCSANEVAHYGLVAHHVREAEAKKTVDVEAGESLYLLAMSVGDGQLKRGPIPFFVT